MSREQDIEKVLGAVENILGRVKENKPEIQFNWWSTGQQMGREEFARWEKDVDELETKLKATRGLVEELGSEDKRTVNAVIVTYYTARWLERIYKA